MTPSSRLLLVGIAIADLLAAIDSTAVVLAMPKIAHDLSLSTASVSLLQIVYTFALITALIPSGKLGDSIGHKKVFIFGLALFGISSLLLTGATSFTILLLLRIIQGIAGGIMYTSGGGLIAHHWKSTETAFGVTAAVFSFGMLIGPLLGGVLTDHTFGSLSGWHLIFLINVPIALLGVWLIKKFAKETTDKVKKAHLDDGLGLLLLALFLASLISCLMYGGFKWATGLASIVFLGALILREIRTEKPLLDLGMFKTRTFAAIAIFTTLAMFALNALTFINTFYVQDVLQKPAETAGLMLIPISIGMAVFAGISSTNKNWKRGALIGGTLIVAGLMVLTRVTPSIPYIQGLLIGYILVSAGAGFMMTTTFAAALGSVSIASSGIAAGYINTVQQLGSLSGIAFVATQDIAHSYQTTYGYLVLVAIVGLGAAFFVKNQSIISDHV